VVQVTDQGMLTLRRERIKDQKPGIEQQRTASETAHPGHTRSTRMLWLPVADLYLNRPSSQRAPGGHRGRDDQAKADTA
jgi:hypothetical protein